MKRHCLTLDLKEDEKLIKEYEYWHKPENIWPEIVAGIKRAGILDMQIYRWETRMFMILDVPDDFDFEKDMKKLSAMPRQQEWEIFMDKFQQRISGMPGEKWVMMKNIFSLIDT